MRPFFSIINRTYNRVLHLLNVIYSLNNQLFKLIEIIDIDNESWYSIIVYKKKHFELCTKMMNNNGY